MAMPKFNKPEGMLDSIKSKLGFSDGGDYYDRGRKDYDDYDSGDYDDYDDDYEEDDAAHASRARQSCPHFGRLGRVSPGQARLHRRRARAYHRARQPEPRPAASAQGQLGILRQPHHGRPGVHCSGQHAQRQGCGSC